MVLFDTDGNLILDTEGFRERADALVQPQVDYITHETVELAFKRALDLAKKSTGPMVVLGSISDESVRPS